MIFNCDLKIRLRTCLIFSILVILINYFMNLNPKLILFFLFISNISVLVDNSSYKIENNILYINKWKKRKINISEIKYIKKSVIDLNIFLKYYKKGNYYILFNSNKSIEIDTTCKNNKNQTLIDYLVKEYNIKLKG